MTSFPTNQDAYKIMQHEIFLNLGGNMVDVELDPDHYTLAIKMALERYRTRSENSVEESFIFLDLQPDTMQYKLPEEVIDVRSVYRRGIGGATSGTGGMLDPFSMAFTNSLYLMPSGAGSLSLYDAAAQYQQTVGRLFGIELLWHYDSATKTLTFHRKFVGTETVVMWCYNYRPDNILLTDHSSKQWLRAYSLAAAKRMLGEARSKFSQIVGPQGGVTLNGERLISDAMQEMAELELELMNQKDGQSEGYGILIG